MKQALTLSAVIGLCMAANSGPAALDVNSRERLSLPALSQGAPAAGKRVKVTPPEYAGTEVYHTVYLPANWNPGGERLPIIFEYTGNCHPKSGSTGQVKDAALGYGLSGGRYIWVSLPYIAEDHKHNAVTWWGDEQATIGYARLNVPRIIEEFRANPAAVFLCGFSRGAIGVNYIGLADDEIAGLWTAFITHDHFDGVREWRNTDWGYPLTKYREGAAARLKRVGGRPYLVSQNERNMETQTYLRASLPSLDNFTFSYISAKEIFGEFPNSIAIAAHTDRWLLLPGKYRRTAWEWMNQVTAGRVANTRNLQQE